MQCGAAWQRCGRRKKLAEQPFFSAAAMLPSGPTLQFPRVRSCAMRGAIVPMRQPQQSFDLSPTLHWGAFGVLAPPLKKIL